MLAALPQFWTSPITTFVLMLLGFGLVIFIHELGHFLVAKWVGIRVDEFALGFGRRLFSFRRGETEYRLNILPLGGYVKMLGQDDFKPKDGEEADPRAFNNRPIWARIAVVSAGVVMNVILAAVLFMIVFSVGISFPPTRLGGVEPAFPPDLVQLPNHLGMGLKPGDEIIALNGKPINKFNKLQVAATLSDEGELFRMRVRRPGVEDPFEVALPTETIKSDKGTKLPLFGLAPCSDRVINDSSDPDLRKYIKDAFRGELLAGDTVVAVDGKSIQQPWDLQPAMENVGPGSTSIEVLREGQSRTVQLSGSLNWSRAAERLFRVEGKKGNWLFPEPSVRKNKETDWNKIPSFNVLGLRPRMRIESVTSKSPAEDIGLKTGDIVAFYSDPNGGDIVPSWEAFREINKNSVGKTLSIHILRGDTTIQSKVEVKKFEGEGRVGFSPEADDQHLVIADVMPLTPLFSAKDKLAGSTVTAVNDQPVKTWAEFIAAVSSLKPTDSVELSYTTPMGGSEKLKPVPLAQFGYDPSLPIADYYAWPLLSLRNVLAPLDGPKTYAAPLEALSLGVQETGDFIVLTYATLKQFVKGRVSGAQFSGPVGIFRAGLMVGKHRGPIWVIWLLAVISANLAVINFLPLPIVDGGHVVFLVIEKIRRRPLSVRLQNAVQIAGLVAIGVAFVLLTYNDIRQWLSSQWH